MKPSTQPLLHSSVNPARTAARSLLKPAAKLRIAVERDSSASFSYLSRSSPLRSSCHLGELLGQRRGVGEGFVRFAQSFEVPFLFLIEFLFVTHE